MPELPEVETTRRGIDAIIKGQALRRLVVREPRMRWPIPADLPALLADRPVLATDRRGKYLLLRFEHGVQIIHLGMSGSLRRVAIDEAPANTITSTGCSTTRFSGCTIRAASARSFGIRPKPAPSKHTLCSSGWG
ncbi:formamidopyrimidine-DNA glycosylase N-terminal domain protein [Bordetella holmesii 35009]|nr:formamidopyrimidine-DNA glycosylase N-terminal domain protein [Bordetella holmesii 35009]